ncbi:TlpA family protein disulfide reductase [Streptomyces flavofungini]|uniref:TlpA family protein disulfide reductase n=1 Tax=Streptomyces flavofungini TaxID=68200 RepID=UPI0034DE4E98
MPYVVTLLVLLGALCIFNLVLSLGILRRIREGAEGASQELTPQVMRADGEKVTAFRAATTDGAELSESLLAEGPTLVAAFAQGCPECEEGIPLFAEYAASFPGGRSRVIAVLIGDPAALQGKAEVLEPVAQVVVEGKNGPLGSALGVRGYPAFGIIDDRATVKTSGIRLEYLTSTPLGA